MASAYPKLLYAANVSWPQLAAYFGQGVDFAQGMTAPAMNAAGFLAGLLTGPLVIKVFNSADEASANAAGYVSTYPPKPPNYG